MRATIACFIAAAMVIACTASGVTSTAAAQGKGKKGAGKKKR